MGNHYLFNAKENNKISLAQFIRKLFVDYNNLYMINLWLCNSSFVEKGKKIESKQVIKLGPTFKYEDFYFLWFNDGVKTFLDKNEIAATFNQDILLKMLNDNTPVNFYLLDSNKKITYQEFESLILSKEELCFPEIIFEEKKMLSFCRENIEEDIETFLGKEIISKKNAIQLETELSSKNIKNKLIKI